MVERRRTMSRIGWGIIGVVTVGGLTAWWLLQGRYLVEGGKAPWAVINQRHDVLEEVLASGVSAEEKDDALRRAASKRDVKALQMLLAAGASPNPPRKGFCLLSSLTRYGEVKMAGLLIEGGADPLLCDIDIPTMVAELITYGHDDAPESEILWTLSLLIARDPDKNAAGRWDSALVEARKYQVPQVAAFLEDPSAKTAARPKDTAGERPLGKSGSLDLDDLKTVCTGAALADAAPYVKQDGYAAQVYYFERRHEGFFWPGRGPGNPNLPEWWTSWDDPSHTQLVACIDAVEKAKINVCYYEGEGGGITLYDATYTLTLYEARTGQKLDSKTFAKKLDPSCPMVKSGTAQEGLFPPYSDELKAFLMPYVGGPS
jgi:hypothetical protein